MTHGTFNQYRVWPVAHYLLVALLLCVACLGAVQAAETRVALIVGNSAYQRSELKLANPANDASAMAKALKAAGFDAVVRLDAKRQDFYRAVDEFGEKIARDAHAVGLFYYAGHAVQANGANYLIPIDAEIESESDLEANAFDVARVLKVMKAAQNDMNIVILDSCRNNPLPKTRGMDRGLARMDAPSGTFIAYAAAPGQTAQDGTSGGNGVFTGELIKAMAESGVPLEQMFKKVIVGVKADTHGNQQPWSEASIQGDFFFHPAGAGADPTAGATAAVTPVAMHVDSATELEQSYWNRIKNSANSNDFKEYLSKYPSGAHANEAGLLARRSTTTPVAPRSADRNSASRVDGAVLGNWTMQIPSPQGPSTCFWTIKADATYASWCTGAHPAAHSGTVLIADGKWAINATTMSWSDGGTYQLPNANTMVMTGKLGTGAWLRK